ncbi:MAG: hypothetical protein AB1706_10335 [Pseudomonadota bacterium]
MNEENIFDKLKNELDHKQKVVIDKSMANQYDVFANGLGKERVVVDRRLSDRRSMEERRANGESNFFFEKRDDSSGRRKSDRRNNEHVFINNDYLRRLTEEF